MKNQADIYELIQEIFEQTHFHLYLANNTNFYEYQY
jgi:hypothetical protein